MDLWRPRPFKHALWGFSTRLGKPSWMLPVLTPFCLILLFALLLHSAYPTASPNKLLLSVGHLGLLSRHPDLWHLVPSEKEQNKNESFLLHSSRSWCLSCDYYLKLKSVIQQIQHKCTRCCFALRSLKKSRHLIFPSWTGCFLNIQFTFLFLQSGNGSFKFCDTKEIAL